MFDDEEISRFETFFEGLDSDTKLAEYTDDIPVEDEIEVQEENSYTEQKI